MWTTLIENLRRGNIVKIKIDELKFFLSLRRFGRKEQVHNSKRKYNRNRDKKKMEMKNGNNEVE